MKGKELIGKIKLGVKRNAPELLLGAGLVTGTACVITASKATLKAKKIKEESNIDKAELAVLFEQGDITEPEFKQAIVKHYSKLGLSLLKEYAVPLSLYGATVGLVFSSYKIQKNRQMALSAALTACTTAYSALVTKLKNGAQNGLTAKEVLEGVEVVEKINPETGEVTTTRVQGEPVGNLYSVRFDKYSTCWEKDKFQNECTLQAEQNWANDRLRLQGYLFLNDVYDRLGLPRTKAGQIVGWTLDGEGDGYVDFGIVDASTYDDVRFDNNAFDLDFNVDGDILTKF